MTEELLVFKRRLSFSQLGEIELKNGTIHIIKPGVCCICGNEIDPKFSSGVCIGDRCEECSQKNQPVFIPGENIRLISHSPGREGLSGYYKDMVIEILVDGRWHQAKCHGNAALLSELPEFADIRATELTQMIDSGQLACGCSVHQPGRLQE